MKDLRKFENPLFEEWIKERGEPYKFVNNKLIHTRVDLAEKYAWAIPNALALHTISKYSPILEVGAGQGYWARLLKDYDCDVVAVDPYRSPPEDNWTKIWEGGFEKIPVFLERTLFCCWMPEYILIEEIGKYKPIRFIWVGEPIKLNRYKQIERVEIPQWQGYNDALFVFRRTAK